MKHLVCSLLAALSLLSPLNAADSKSRSGVLTLPSTNLHAVFSAAQDVLKRECTIDKSVADQRLEASVTYYDSASTVQSGTVKSTLAWTLGFRAESDGRIAVSILHTVAGPRPPESLVRFARELATAAKAPSTGPTLQLNGVTKPLAGWKRS